MTEPEQLSVAEAVVAGKFTVPPEPNVKVNEAGAVIVGEIVSTTVTLFVAVEAFPLPSVAVIVTVSLPKSEQPKLVVLKLTVGAVVQLSVVLDTTSDVEIDPEPFASRYTVTADPTVAIVGAV